MVKRMYICHDCGKILQYPETAAYYFIIEKPNDIDQGITLCKKHYFHRRYNGNKIKIFFKKLFIKAGISRL
jgi:hypothetical protein